MVRGNLPPEAPAGGASIATPQRLQALAAELGLELAEPVCTALLDYAALLRRWNRVHNLTAIERPEELLSHHLLDCLAIVAPLRAALPRHGLPGGGTALAFLDAGSGAGLPGIPLALVEPAWRGQLVDAVEKKCAFLRQACLELGLRNLQVQHARLEALRLPPQQLIVSRAFASLADFVRLTRPQLAPGGLWAAMKGRRIQEELDALGPETEWLETITLRVPLLDEQRHLVLLRPRAAHAAAGTSPRA
jgi:16S rRNA (guanine527-N7)-methyltransferase